MTAIFLLRLSADFLLRFDLDPMRRSHLLDDDVLGTADHAQATALDDTLAALTNQGLVGANSDTEQTGLVANRTCEHENQPSLHILRYLLGNGSSRRIRLVVGAPVILVDGNLAGRAGTPGLATSGRSGALGVGEVETIIHDQPSSIHRNVPILTSCSRQ